MSTDRTVRARSTLSWGLLDQVVASGSNFLFVVIAATSLKAHEFGAIAFAFEFYLLSIFVARGVAGDPLASRFAGRDHDGLRSPVRGAAAASVLVGTGLGLLVAVGALFADSPLRNVLLVASISLPFLTLQDFVRTALIVQGRVRSTFLNDLFWAVVQVPAMVLVIVINPTAPGVIAAWAGTGGLAALIGLVQLRYGRPLPRSVPGWLKETKDIWPYYLADNLIYGLTSLLLMIVVSATAGLAAMAGFRVAMTVYAPLSLVGRGVIGVAVAMLARRRDDPSWVRSRALLISGVLTPLAIIWGLLTLLVPTDLGEVVFGPSWAEAEPLVFLASFVCAGGLFTTGVAAGLRALSAGRRMLTGRLVLSIAGSIAAAVGGVLGQEHGVFLALAIFFPVQVIVWSTLLLQAASGAKSFSPANGSLDA